MKIPRRDFIALVGGASIAWPLAARAQQVMPVIGYLGMVSAQSEAPRLKAFRRGLGEVGYIEGQNVTIEYRWAEGQNDRLPTMAADLVNRHVSVVVASGHPATLGARSATTTIPIVFQSGVDPVAAGLVASLNRPSGNLTGTISLSGALGPKQLELLHELLPTATIMALLVNPTNASHEPLLRDVQAAARDLGLQLHPLYASNERDFDNAFATMVQGRAAGLLIGPDIYFTSRSEQLAALSVRHSVPAIYIYREFVAAGGMMSYGADLTERYRPIGVYAGRILRGDKPADLPIVQVTRVELIINLKTAKALGITFPLSLLGRADEVIE